MYEDYLEDYMYKLMAKIGSRICRLFKSKKNDDNVNPVPSDSNSETKDLIATKDSDTNKTDVSECLSDNTSNKSKKSKHKVKNALERDKDEENDIDEDLSNLNFHMMMFFLWLVVTIINVPALLTWARNFKYSMVLKPDTSYHTGLVMSICSAFVWQLEGPRRNLRYYEALCSFMFTMALFILVMGVFSLAVVNYGVTLIFTLITIQQVWDSEIGEKEVNIESSKDDMDDQKSEVIKESQGKENSEEENHSKPTEEKMDDKNKESEEETNKCTEDEIKETPDDCDVCSESRIYRVFKNLRDKFSFNNDV